MVRSLLDACARRGLVVLCLLCPVSAEAQQINHRAGPLDTNMTMQIVHPTTPGDAGTIFCGYPDPGCISFNRAACNPNPDVPIELTFTQGTGGTVSGTLGTMRAYAWLQNYPGLCYTPTIQITGDTNLATGSSIWGLPAQGIGAPQGALNPLTSSSAFVAGSLATDLPYDFQSAPLLLSQIMRAFPEICGQGVQLRRYKLCVGISASGNPTLNNASNNPSGTASGDLTAGFEFPIDTVPPPAPGLPSTRGLVRRVEGTLTYDTSVHDVYRVNLRHSANPSDQALTADPNAGTVTCEAWQHGTTQVFEATDQSGAISFSVDGINGVPIAFCAQAIDYLGNPSPWSAVVQNMPHDESDLFAAWPEGVPLQVGFCGAAADPAWWPLLGLGWLVRRVGPKRWGRRRTQRQPARRAWFAGVLLGLGLLVPAAARAQSGLLSAPLPKLNFPRFVVDLSVGLYRPTLSSDAAVQAVRNRIHDDRAFFKHPLLYQLQVDYLPLQAFGLLGPYASLGYSTQAAASRVCRDPTGAIVHCTGSTILGSEAGTDTSNLAMLPVGLGLVYQMDALRRLYNLPLSFVGRAGLDYRFWWASLGEFRALVDGDPRRPARGGNLGASAAAAIYVGLDGLLGRHPAYGTDPSGRDTSFFVEYALVYGGNLLAPKGRIDLSDLTQINAGLAIGFR
jgi:hypothetical protein